MCAATSLKPMRNAELCERARSEEHTSELQSLRHLVCRLLLGKSEVAGKHAAVCVKSAGRVRAFNRLVSIGPRLVIGEHNGVLITTLGDGIERLDAYVSRNLS